MEKLNYKDIEKVVAGKTLKEWYDKVLAFGMDKFSEGGSVVLWSFHENLEEAIKKLETIEEWLWLDSWGCRWEDLQEREKEILKECFAKVITDVWRYSWEVIRFVLSDKPQTLAKCKDWRKGKFPRGTIEEAMLRITRIGLARNMGERDVVKDIVKRMIEGENEEWKEWLARKVWLNLAEEMME